MQEIGRKGQIVGFALAQHFGQVPLGVYIQCQNLFTSHGKASPQVIDSGASESAGILETQFGPSGIQRDES